MPSPLTTQHYLTKLLELELLKLKSKFQMAHELKVEWIPDGNSKKSGEVIDRTMRKRDLVDSQGLWRARRMAGMP